VEEYWRRWPNAGIGCATGPSGLAVFDPDGPKGAETLGNFLKVAEEAATKTAFSRTSRGHHVFYQAPEGGVPSKADPTTHLDVRGIGGFVVLPPSPHVSGHIYRWERTPEDGIAQCPQILVEYARTKAGKKEHQGREPASPVAALQSGEEIPAGQGLPAGPNVSAILEKALGELIDWQEVLNALGSIPPDCGRDQWYRIGMALHSTRHPKAFTYWDIWSSFAVPSRGYAEKYRGIEDTTRVWASFSNDKPGGITLGTLFAIAFSYGYSRSSIGTREEVRPADGIFPTANNETPPPVNHSPGAGEFSKGETPSDEEATNRELRQLLSGDTDKMDGHAVPAKSLRWEKASRGALKPKSYQNTSLALATLGIPRSRHDPKILGGDDAEVVGD
jgi:hypothetical protein